MHKKILIVTPSLPFPKTGAEQADRANGFLQLKKMGYQIKVIAKIPIYRTLEEVQKISQLIGIEILSITYKYNNGEFNFPNKLIKLFKRLVNIKYLDGAALEYTEPEIKKVFEEQLKDWQPDYVWFDYTYLWPLYVIAKRYKLPVITRSINFEAIHFLQEDGCSLINIIKSIPKFISEYIIVKKSKVIFAITPKEERIYKSLGGKEVFTLPLRSLPACLRKTHNINDHSEIKIFFMGSTYNVSHNRQALEFIIKNIAPTVEKKYPGKFTFFILGSKVPDNLKVYFNERVIYLGALYGDELEKFLLGMDIALIPYLFGAGMQQKIFEPLSRGIPTITNKKGIAEYPFEHRKHVYLANTLEEYINGLVFLMNASERQKLSSESIKLAWEIFSEEKLNSIVKNCIV
jgi:hypothetical protein